MSSNEDLQPSEKTKAIAFLFVWLLFIHPILFVEFGRAWSLIISVLLVTARIVWIGAQEGRKWWVGRKAA